MSYTNPRALGTSPAGPTLATLNACTLADYTVAGTAAPAVDDVVTVSTTGNWYVKMAADGATAKLGKVTKVELAPSGTALGYVAVEWYDAIRVVELTTDDLSSCTLGNSAIKDGDTTVEDNFDAGSTTGNLIVVAKSGTSGAGTVAAMLFAA